jgi:hypothetical protein
LLRSVKRPHVHFELWLFECDLAVSFQQNDNCNLNFEEGQMLSDAGSLSCTEREVAEGFGLCWVAFAPSFRPELKWIRVELVFKVIRFHHSCD